MLHMAVEAAFEDLLAKWRAHHSRQGRGGVSLPELAQSRQALDRARQRMHRLRSAIYPEGDELDAVVESIWCESLESVVHLRWEDRHPIRPGNLMCACGHLVAVRWDELPRPS